MRATTGVETRIGEAALVNLLELREGMRFESFCKALLREKFPRFQGFSPPDGGIDGYDDESETVFQFYFPEGAPRKDKVIADIQKVLNSGGRFKAWVLILPKDPSPAQSAWVDTAFSGTPIRREIWGKTQIEKLLRDFPAVRDEFFPTEVRRTIKRLAKGKKPCTGDAEEWQAINAEECEGLRELVESLAEEGAKRKRRKVLGSDYSREYGEFNSHFKLSAYDRLNRSLMGDARRYLEQKLYARRQGESKSGQRKRRIDGIHGIKQALRIDDAEYRRELLAITGSDSLRELNLEQLEMVFQRLKTRQRKYEAQSA
jgi:hypothetical protein